MAIVVAITLDHTSLAQLAQITSIIEDRMDEVSNLPSTPVNDLDYESCTNFLADLASVHELVNGRKGQT